MAYERINWQNGESGNTPLNANNLNRMDMTLEEHDQKIGDHDYEIENLKTGEQGITEELNKKMDRINPQGSGTFSIPAVNADNITAQTVETDEIKVTKVGSKGGTAPVVFDNDILVNGITTPIGSLASSASAKAESAERIANEADREAGTARTIASTAYSRVQENIFRTDKLEGIVGGGVGESIPQYTYYNGKYLRPDGEIANYNDSARVIEFEINKNSDSGCNVIFKNVDLIPTDASILCGFYNAAGILLGEEMRGLIIMADFDEDTGKMTRQYISYCVVPAPYYAKYVRISGIANGAVDIAIQNTLSDAVAELQSRSTSALVLTNPSPLPATDGKKILGIDALGKSWQDIINFEQGTLISEAAGKTYEQAKQDRTDRIRFDNVCESTAGNMITVTVESSYEAMVKTFDSNKIYVGTTGWGASVSMATSNYYVIILRKAAGGNIVPADASSANIVVTGAKGFKPTPATPIPITDANPEVIAIGKNLFDGENITSGKYIGDDGSIGNDNPSGYTDLITVTPNTTYTFSALSGGGGRKRIHAYDSNGNWIRLLGSVLAPSRGTAMSLTVTTPSNAKYIRLSYSYNNAYEGGANNDKNVQIEVGATVSAYETYQSNSASLPFDPESAGSAANELIVYEDGTGKIIKRIGTYTFSGNEQFSYTESWGFRHAFTLSELGSKIKPIATNDSYGNLMHPNFYISTRNATQVKADEGMMAQNTANQIFFCTNAYSDAKDFADAIKGTTLIYEMRTPIEIPLTAEEVAAVRQLMTYKGTTIIESEMDVVSVTYSGDIKAYIDYRIDQIINPTALNEVAPMNLDETEE